MASMSPQRQAAFKALCRGRDSPDELWQLIADADGRREAADIVRYSGLYAGRARSFESLLRAIYPIVGLLGAADHPAILARERVTADNAVELIEAVIHAFLLIPDDADLPWRPKSAPEFPITEGLCPVAFDVLATAYRLAFVVHCLSSVPVTSIVRLFRIGIRGLEHAVAGIRSHPMTPGHIPCRLSAILSDIHARHGGSPPPVEGSDFGKAILEKKEISALLALVILTSQWPSSTPTLRLQLVMEIADPINGVSAVMMLAKAMPKLKSLEPHLFARLGGIVAEGLRAAVGHTDPVKLTLIAKGLAICGEEQDRVLTDPNAVQAVVMAHIGHAFIQHARHDPQALSAAKELLGPVMQVVKLILSVDIAAPIDVLQESAAPIRLLYVAMLAFGADELARNNAIELLAVASFSRFWTDQWYISLAMSIKASPQGAARVYAMVPALQRRLQAADAATNDLARALRLQGMWATTAALTMKLEWPTDNRKRCSWIRCTSSSADKLHACSKCRTNYCSPACQRCARQCAAS